MNVVLWIIQIVLALAFLAAGSMKALQPKEKITANPQMGWANDFSEPMIKLIGAAEILGALGLILPAVTKIAPVLTPIAAVGLGIIMIGAIAVHARRKENQALVPPLVLLILCAVVAWGRFGPYSISS